MNTEIMKQFAKLDSRRAALEAELKEVKERIKEVEPQVLDEMTQNEVSNIRIDGRTIYVQSQIWGRKKAPNETIVKALRDAGLEDFVSEGFNMQSISAFIREKVKNGESLPPQFNGVLEANEVFSVRSRAA